MLVLSRKPDEEIVSILDRETLLKLLANCPPEGHHICAKVVEVRGDKVRLGFDAPRCVTVHRREVYNAIKRQGAKA